MCLRAVFIGLKYFKLFSFHFETVFYFDNRTVLNR